MREKKQKKTKIKGRGKEKSHFENLREIQVEIEYRQRTEDTSDR